MSLENILYCLKDSDPVTNDTSGTVNEEGVIALKKATFYAQDTAAVTSDASNSSKKKYMGHERRRKNRRTTLDRRNDVRFELNKADRRSSAGRRDNDATIRFW